MPYSVWWARGDSAVECQTTNAEGWDSNPGTKVCAPDNPAVNGYLGQPGAMGTCRDAIHITPLLTEAVKAVCALQHQPFMRRAHDGTTFTFLFCVE